ncbi:MAG TPA: ribonuclease HII [Bryobacteraceae bacterium]|nr:ribonuclease HII [Bryobacteraceae bacterium]
MGAQPAKRTTIRGTHERAARKQGYVLVAGADEAGRGSLFGPVFAAAVILNPEAPIRGLRDSKQLLPDRREELAVRIRQRAICWAVATADAAEIDTINIYQASRLAVRRAIEMLLPAPDYLLIDALAIDLPLPQRGLIHGDAICPTIAAASILAKVDRDACMREWDARYPQYGLARHKGYCTPEHLEALALHGPTPFHRMSYEPVRQIPLFRPSEMTACH